MRHLSWLLLLSLALALETDFAQNTHEEEMMSFEYDEVFRIRNRRDDINYLVESTPLKQALTYGSTLAYQFILHKDNWNYESLVFISAVVCQLPTGWDLTRPENGLSLYFTYNETLAQNLDYGAMERVQFVNGYADGLAEVVNVDDFNGMNATDTVSQDEDNDDDNISIVNQDNTTSSKTDTSDGQVQEILYLYIKTDDCSTCSENSHWEFQIGVSQSNLLFTYDTDSLINIIGVDYDSAIFNTTNIEANAGNKTVQLFTFNSTFDPIVTALNQSWCAINELVQSKPGFSLFNINSTTVNNLTDVLPVTGLKQDTDYKGVVVVSSNQGGGSIFKSLQFKTTNSTACKLAYNLDFCDEVAYSVPNSLNFTNGEVTWEEVAAVYDQNARDLFRGFNYALQLTTCNANLESRYSPLRTCEDCAYSYRQWLCAVSIPRCASIDEEFLKHHNVALTKYPAHDGRSDFIKNVINPPLDYNEVLPCLSNCYAIVRDCPPQFGFGCPNDPELISQSYGNDQMNEFCNVVGSVNQTVSD